MGVENATTIAGLNPAWPLGSDPKSEGDNHLRQIKDVMQKDAARLSGANTFKGAQTIEAAAPYLSYSETDVAANIGKWSAGLSGGTYVIQPRDSAGAVMSGAGFFSIERDATGVLAYNFGFVQAGTSIVFNGAGTMSFNRSGYGSTAINTAGQGFKAGGAGQGNLTRHYAGFSPSDALNYAVLVNGNVQNSNNSYGAISDLRVKTAIADAGPQLADVLALRVVNFTLIEDPEQLKQIGLVAQEVLAVKPGLVEEDPETGMLGVKYSVLVPILLKAVQELALRIEAIEGAA
jgi:hypothetical protein